MEELKQQIEMLKQQVESLKAEFYRNNFSTHQEFQKYSDFKTRLKVPSYNSDPSTGAVGEIIEVGGKLKICSSANNFVIVGTQS